jgi:hypothetical protein
MSISLPHRADMEFTETYFMFSPLAMVELLLLGPLLSRRHSIRQREMKVFRPLHF